MTRILVEIISASSQEAIATRVMLDTIEAATCLNFVESSSATNRIRVMRHQSQQHDTSQAFRSTATRPQIGASRPTME